MANSATRTIFLTGSTGYIGSRLAQMLLLRGHYVKALVLDHGAHSFHT